MHIIKFGINSIWICLKYFNRKGKLQMIDLPDFSRNVQWENNFYLSCDTMRIGKIIAQYELFKIAHDLPGSIVECGVFKGTSLARFAMFRSLFGNPFSKKIIAFDTFDHFPDTNYEPDKRKREEFISVAGEHSISTEQMMEVLKHKSCDSFVELVAGDICNTVPRYIAEHPELKISLLNLDTDIYEPAVVILQNLYPRIVTGGVVILDDYGIFPGETRAVDEFFKNKNVVIQKFSFCMTPCYLIKK